MAAEPLNDDLSELVSAAINVSSPNGRQGNMTHYLRWNFRNLLTELHPKDLTDDELMACNVVLAQAMARKLALACPGDMFGAPLVIPGIGGPAGPPLRGRPPLCVVVNQPVN